MWKIIRLVLCLLFFVPGMGLLGALSTFDSGFPIWWGMIVGGALGLPAGANIGGACLKRLRTSSSARGTRIRPRMIDLGDVSVFDRDAHRFSDEAAIYGMKFRKYLGADKLPSDMTLAEADLLGKPSTGASITPPPKSSPEPGHDQPQGASPANGSGRPPGQLNDSDGAGGGACRGVAESCWSDCPLRGTSSSTPIYNPCRR